MTPFPPFGWVFIVGVSGVTPSAGLMVLFLGWWKQWGTTGSSNVGKPPLGGTTPSTKHPSKAGVKGCDYVAFSMVVTYTAN